MQIIIDGIFLKSGIFAKAGGKFDTFPMKRLNSFYRHKHKQDSERRVRALHYIQH